MAFKRSGVRLPYAPQKEVTLPGGAFLLGRGISSVGRAIGSQSIGQGFESPILHKKTATIPGDCLYVKTEGIEGSAPRWVLRSSQTIEDTSNTFDSDSELSLVCQSACEHTP